MTRGRSLTTFELMPLQGRLVFVTVILKKIGILAEDPSYEQIENEKKSYLESVLPVRNLNFEKPHQSLTRQRC